MLVVVRFRGVLRLKPGSYFRFDHHGIGRQRHDVNDHFVLRIPIVEYFFEVVDIVTVVGGFRGDDGYVFFLDYS